LAKALQFSLKALPIPTLGALEVPCAFFNYYYLPVKILTEEVML
jgi:hypothetical protein